MVKVNNLDNFIAARQMLDDKVLQRLLEIVVRLTAPPLYHA